MRNILLKIIRYFRKHDFQLSGYISFGEYKFPKYECSKCGDILCLDDWQMKSLPWSMARGCRRRK